VRIALAQINPTVGDLAGNRRLVEESAAKAAAAGARLVVFPELALTGYPPMDLLERRGFVDDQLRELDALAAASQRIAIAVGAVVPVERRGGKSLANAAVLLAGGRRVAAQAKTLLPTYDVFDENRYFVPAEKRGAVALDGAPLGLTVCEDGWVEPLRYEVDPTGDLALQGAQLVTNLSASPWHVGKPAERRALFRALARRHRVPIVFVNQVGGNDELIFDGGSFYVDAAGEIRASLPLFEPALEVIDTGRAAAGARRSGDPRADRRGAARGRPGARHPRLLREAEPAAGRRDRALGRRRLGGDGAPRHAGARRRPRARRADARAFLVGPQRRGRARTRAADRHRDAHRRHPRHLRALHGRRLEHDPA
jgi:predicted amidohydrolase